MYSTIEIFYIFYPYTKIANEAMGGSLASLSLSNFQKKIFFGFSWKNENFCEQNALPLEENLNLQRKKRLNISLIFQLYFLILTNICLVYKNPELSIMSVSWNILP